MTVKDDKEFTSSLPVVAKTPKYNGLAVRMSQEGVHRPGNPRLQ